MTTRLQHIPTSLVGAHPLKAPPVVLEPASHAEWLSSLRRGDTVRIRNGEQTMPPAMVTNDSPCYVFVGKLKFHRRHGWQVKRGRAYRMELRLVRNEQEFT
jgi:hypothetical protein